MKKRVFSVLLAALLLTSLFPVTVFADELAASGTLNEKISWAFDKDTGVLTITGEGPMPDYAYAGSGKTTSPFSGKDGIKTMTIGEGITTVGAYAFYLSEELTHVQLPSTVTTIRADAFSQCFQLRWCGLPGNLTAIEADAFSYTALYLVGIPDNVTTIGPGAFASCKKLKEFVTGVANKNFDADEYGVLYKLTDGVKTTLTAYPGGIDEFDTYIVPDTVTSIGPNAFCGCQTIKNVVLPENVTWIGRAAFYDCRNLERIALTDKITGVEALAFSSTNVKEIYFTGNQTKWITFKGLVPLADDTLLKNEPTVHCYAEYGACGEHMFYFYNDPAEHLEILGCGEMEAYDTDMWPSPFGSLDAKTVYIGENIGKVSDYAFFENDELTDFEVDENNENYVADDGVLYTANMGTLVAYPAGRTDESCQIPDTTDTVGTGAFYNAKDLKQVTIPISVQDVCEDAFYGCDNLATVYYGGIREEWESTLINIMNDSGGNDPLLNAKIIFTVRAFPIKITDPVAGEKPDDKVQLIFGEPYTVSSVKWEPADETFAAGKEYTLTVTVEAKDGYRLEDDAAMANATVNGKKADYEMKIRPMGHQFFIYGLITYTFPAVEDPNKTYTVKVENGAADPTAAAKGATVTVTAAAAPEGQTFDKWTVVKGGVTLKDAAAAATTFVMGDADVELKATYKDKPAEAVKLGDVDGDGEIKSGDARLALRASVKLETFWNQPDNVQYKAANVDKDDKISANDARMILRASVKLEDPSKW